MSQNEILIQYLSVVLYEELTKESAKRFLESKAWSLYLYIKRFCVLVNADKLSEGQVRELEDVIHEMLQTRLDLVSGKGKILGFVKDLNPRDQQENGETENATR